MAMVSRVRLASLGVALAVVVASGLALADPAPQGKGKGKDAAQRADMELFHDLLDHRKEITRTVTKRPDGVETVTESADPKVAEKVREHVTSMEKRLKDRRPIHARDPLFAEVFRNADKVKMKSEKTPKGVKVLETSDDPLVAKLIQAHAEVVSLFLKNGHAEVRKDHAPPKRD
jgi:hypothetical protein